MQPRNNRLWALFLVSLLSALGCGEVRAEDNDMHSGKALDVPPGHENRLGFSVLFTPPATAAVGQTIKTPLLRVNAHDPTDPQSLFLQLQAETLTLGTQVRDLKARLSWGSGGAQFAADVDFLQGTTIELAASSVEVSAIFRALSAGTPSAFKFGGSLAYGTRPSNPVSPSFTTDRTTINNGSSFNFVVPAWATDVRVFAGDPAATCQVFLLDDGLNTFAAFNQAASADLAYPILNNVSTVQVTNNSGAANNFIARFGLSL